MPRLFSPVAFWLTLIACALIGGVAAPVASADRDYTLRFGQVERGNVAIVANTSMSCPSSVSTCADARNGTGGADVIRNSMYTMTHVDVDADATTFNSSSADLRLPSGATVLFAGLYWGSDTKAGVGGVDAPDAAQKGTVRFSANAGWSYHTVTATQMDVSRVFDTRYQGFADVTQTVRGAGAGTYAVANVQAATGRDNFGGWGLVVAYTDPAEDRNWIGVYDGFRQFTDDNVYNTNLDGFKTPATGTVEADFGMLSYEGDLGVSGDITQIAGQDLSDPLHAAGNYWNSRITDRGQYVHAKNPDYLHQMGHEANIMEIDGILPNAATTVPVRLGVSTDYLQTGPMTLVSDQETAEPRMTMRPVVTGVARDGETLTASTGTWSGAAPMEFSYQWQRCTGAACADLAGKTASTYVLTPADVGATVRVAVTARNADGSAESTSLPTGTVAARPATNDEAPVLTGTARDGETLTATAGTWSGTPTITYTYRWQRCATACTDIDGAEQTTYALTPADVGTTVRVVVTGTNGGGSADAPSQPTGTVTARAPSNTAKPAVSGTPRDGETLTATTGGWSGTAAITHSYRWQRCASGCIDVGADAATYALGPADVGSTLRVTVTASNGGGSATSTSDPSPTITARPPVNSAAPAVTGTAREGETLTATSGGWTGTPAITHAYQWRRCTALACGDVPGATGASYALVAADVGATMRVAVTAANAAGSATATSEPTGTVLAKELPPPPVDPDPPVEDPDPPVQDPPPANQPPREEPRGEVLSTVQSSPPACDALQATRTNSPRRTTLQLRLRIDEPATSVNFAIAARLLPKRTAGSRAVGSLRLQRGTRLGGAVALRFQRGSKTSLTSGRSPRLRITRTGVRVTGLPPDARLVVVTLHSPPWQAVDAITVRSETRTAAGTLVRFSCTPR